MTAEGRAEGPYRNRNGIWHAEPPRRSERTFAPPGMAPFCGPSAVSRSRKAAGVSTGGSELAAGAVGSLAVGVAAAGGEGGGELQDLLPLGEVGVEVGEGA